MDDLLAEFLAETVEKAETVRDRAGLAGRGDGGDAVAEAFRMAATINATARYLDIPALKAVAEAVESLAGGLRDGRLQRFSGSESLLLAAVGRIEDIAGEMMSGIQVVDGADGDLVSRLRIAANGYQGEEDVNAIDSSLRAN